ncbi:FG-GAP repeat domain-containing protein [Streptomyces sp. NBC_01304]|uniref:FG-GAP repeat domain-containing protein n=1 Tax=Streptomyces sp. NBC_01304 TaxID=2903818 RepID=UPI002E14CD04|nr:VCBS repeat-containing protein [Streptomyces sp. NBC_01304]
MPVRRPRRHLTAALSCTALLLTGCGSGGGGDDDAKLPPAPPASGKPADEPDPADFNGDGYDDYMSLLEPHSKDKEKGTSTLVVVYGSAKGLRPETVTRISAGSTNYAWFGDLSRTDLDGDGFTDLVGTRGADQTGTPFVAYGGARGLGKPAALPGLPKGFLPLAAGDFDGDGSTDLIDGGRGGSGDPDELPGHRGGRLLSGPIERSGKFAREAELDLGQHGYASPQTATTGDFDADGRTDVIFTYSYDAEEDESAPDDLRSVAHYRGSPEGLVDGGTTTPDLEALLGTQDGPRTPHTGDMDGDGIDDLLASGSGAHLNTSRITVVYGAKSGLGKGKAAKELAEKGTYWGVGPRAGDVNGDKVPDLVTGREGFHLIDTDRIILIPGGSQGPDRNREQEIYGDDPGIESKIPLKSEFGVSDLLDVNGDGKQDVIAYSEYDYKGRGAFLVLPGSADGLDVKHAHRFTPEDLGVQLRLK